MFKHTITAEVFSNSEFPEWLTAFQEFLIEGEEHGTASLVSTEEVPDEPDTDEEGEA